MGEKNLSKDGYHENDHVKKDDVDGEYHRVQSGVTVAEPKCKGETPSLDATCAGK